MHSCTAIRSGAVVLDVDSLDFPFSVFEGVVEVLDNDRIGCAGGDGVRGAGGDYIADIDDISLPGE